MVTEKYQLVFHGKIAPDQTIDDVKARLADGFNVDNEKIEKMFSGKKVILKRDCDLETCHQWQLQLEHVGVLSKVESQDPLPMEATLDGCGSPGDSDLSYNGADNGDDTVLSASHPPLASGDAVPLNRQRVSELRMQTVTCLQHVLPQVNEKYREKNALELAVILEDQSEIENSVWGRVSFLVGTYGSYLWKQDLSDGRARSLLQALIWAVAYEHHFRFRYKTQRIGQLLSFIDGMLIRRNTLISNLNAIRGILPLIERPKLKRLLGIINRYKGESFTPETLRELIRSTTQEADGLPVSLSDPSTLLDKFEQFDWEHLIQNNFLKSIGTICDQIQSLAPLLVVDDKHRRQLYLLTKIRKYRYSGFINREKIEYLVRLSSICTSLGDFFIEKGRLTVAEKLSMIAVRPFIIFDPQEAEAQLLKVYELQALVELLGDEETAFTRVYDTASRNALLIKKFQKKNIPTTLQADQCIARVIQRYYAYLLNRAAQMGNTNWINAIIRSNLSQICLVLCENGLWDLISEIVSLCDELAPRVVSDMRSTGQLIESDPLLPPAPVIRQAVLKAIAGEDLRTAADLLRPWFETAHSAINRMMTVATANYRLPTGLYFHKLPKGYSKENLNHIKQTFKQAVAAFRNGNYEEAGNRLQQLPSVGDIAIHPLVREWRALVFAHLGMLSQSQGQFEAAIKGGEVMAETVWNLIVLYCDAQVDKMDEALALLKMVLPRDTIRIYYQGGVKDLPGRSLLGNYTTILAIPWLAGHCNDKTFNVNFILDYYYASLYFAPLLPLGFFLASELDHPRTAEIAEMLAFSWQTKPQGDQWKEPAARITEKELRFYVKNTGGDLERMRELARYLEERYRYYPGWPVLPSLLVDIYDVLAERRTALLRQIEHAMLLLNTGRKGGDNTLRKALQSACQRVQNHQQPWEMLDSLIEALIRNGKLYLIKNHKALIESYDRRHGGILSATAGETSATMTPAVKTQPDQHQAFSTLYNHLPTIDGVVQEGLIDPAIEPELVHPVVKDDQGNAHLVVRLTNAHDIPLHQSALYVELSTPTVPYPKSPTRLDPPLSLLPVGPRDTVYATLPLQWPEQDSPLEVRICAAHHREEQLFYQQRSFQAQARGFDEVMGESAGISPNLYFYGGAVNGRYHHTFKGREAQRQKIIESAKAGNVTYFLDGIPRVGKSSLCMNLIYDPDPEVIAVHVNLEQFALNDEKTVTTSFIRHLLEHIYEAVHQRGHAIFTEIRNESWEANSAITLFGWELKRIRETIYPSYLLLMFDEVQHLLASALRNEKTADRNHYVRNDILEYLAAMFNEPDQRTRFLFAASERFEKIKTGGRFSIFNRVIALDLPFLDFQSTKEILEAGVAGTPVFYTPEAIQTIWDYVRGYPAHVQQIGDRLMERLNRKKRVVVVPRDVERVVEGMVGDAVVFDYQCNRETIGPYEARFLEAMFKGREMLYGANEGCGRGIPVDRLPEFAENLDASRLPSVARGLKYHQVITEIQDPDGIRRYRINGQMLESWLDWLRQEKGGLRSTVFPEKPLGALDIDPAPTPAVSKVMDCVIWIDFENIVRHPSLQSLFIGPDAKPDKATRDFLSKLKAACEDKALIPREINVVAPWSIPELTPYSDCFELDGVNAVTCVKGMKEAADQKVALLIGKQMSNYITSKIGAIIFITSDGHFHATLSQVKGANLKTIVWGIRPGQDLVLTADQVENLLDVVYRDGIH